MTTTLATPPALGALEKAETPALRSLSLRHQEFAIGFVENGGNSTQAYRDIYANRCKGRKDNVVRALASQLLARPCVTRAIQEILRLKGFTPEGIHSKLIAYATNKPSQFEPYLNGSKTLEQLELEGVDSSCIQEILVIVKPGKDGDQVTRKLRFCDAQQAVTTLGKMLGLLDERKRVEFSGVVGVAALDLRDKSDDELAAIRHAMTSDQPPPKLIEAEVVDSVTTD